MKTLRIKPRSTAPSPKPRRPKIGEKIRANGIETTIIAMDLYQPEAPHFYIVNDSSGREIIIDWKDSAWGIAGQPAEPAPKPVVPKPKKPVASVPHDFARVRNFAGLARPANPVRAVAAPVALPPSVQALHAVLDAARDAFQRAGEATRLDRLEDYAAAILAVDQSDPGFYLGRRNPLVPLPKASYSDYAEFIAGLRTPELQEAA